MWRLSAVLARSVRNPLVIGIGSGVGFVAGGAPVAFADTTTSPSATPSGSETSKSPTPKPSDSASKPSTADPAPSDSTSPPPPQPSLSVAFLHYPKSVHPGTKYPFDAQVTPKLPP